MVESTLLRIILTPQLAPSCSNLSTDSRPMKYYTRSYPALAPVANPLGQQRLRRDVFPTIAKGSPIDEKHVELVMNERQQRGLLASKGLVTLQEMFATHEREIAVLAEHLAVQVPTMEAASGPPEERLERIVASLTATSVQSHNECAAGMNKALFFKGHNPVVYHTFPLAHFMNAHDHLGAGTPGVRHDVNQVPRVPVGQMIPSPPFPNTLSAVDGMTMQDIDQLAMLLHRDFGITEGDDLLVRRHKLLLFLAAGTESGKTDAAMMEMLGG